MVKKLMSILNIDFMPTRNISTITDFSKDVKKEETLVEDAEVVETTKAEIAPEVKAEEAPKED